MVSVVYGKERKRKKNLMHVLSKQVNHLVRQNIKRLLNVMLMVKN